MATYLALTTTNYQQNGYHVVAEGTDKEAVRKAAEVNIGDVATGYGTDIYKVTEQQNLIVVSKSEAAKRFGIGKKSRWDWT